jgi:hypothetical protein
MTLSTAHNSSQLADLYLNKKKHSKICSERFNQYLILIKKEKHSKRNNQKI